MQTQIRRLLKKQSDQGILCNNIVNSGPENQLFL